MITDKIAIALISPLGSALVLGALAVSCALFGRRKLATLLVVASLGWLWVCSLPVTSHALRAGLEAPYPLLPIDAVPAAQAIVVLGGSVRPAESATALPDLVAAADRVWHGARLYHAGKAPLVLLSGGSDPTSSATSEAEAMATFLRDLGVPQRAMLLEADSRNTRQNASLSAELLRARGIDRVLLVTSALHMRRASALFRNQGLTVIEIACDHESRSRFGWVDWLPDAAALDGSARALKEWVGYATGR